MNDRLKFRVWDIEEKTYKSSDCPFFLCDDGKVLDTHFDIRDNDVIVEQCTGLKDKNGKLVYEGDIVKLHGCEFMWEVKYDIDCGQFIYERQSPETFPPSKLKPSYIADDFSGCLVCWTEVKGNIHQNPDLLKNPGNFNVSVENVKGDH